MAKKDTRTTEDVIKNIVADIAKNKGEIPAVYKNNVRLWFSEVLEHHYHYTYQLEVLYGLRSSTRLEKELSKYRRFVKKDVKQLIEDSIKTLQELLG